MNSDSVSFEYLLKLRQLTWENAEVIENIFGSIAFEEKSGEQKAKCENWCKKKGEKAFNTTKVDCRQNSKTPEGRLYLTVDYTRAIKVRVSISSLNSHEYIKEYSSLGELNNQTGISFNNTYFSKDVPTAAATHSENFQRNNVCSICHKKFKSKTDLTRHLRTHTGEKPFSCPQCERSFSLKSTLKKHLLIHSGVKEFSCDICQSTFIDESTLKRHLLVHSSTKPFSCDICYKTFRRKSHLTRHRRTHTGEKPFKCEECNEMFSDGSHLKVHMRTHTGETPYQCEICGNKFNQIGSLKAHLLIHSEEKPFACTFANCDKTLRTKSSLQVHVRVHTKDKPYACPKCKKRFSQLSHCKTHTKQCSVAKSVSSDDSFVET